MNWIEINGYLINLDNIAFIVASPDNENQTRFCFIAGQSKDIDIEKSKVVELIKEHHKKIKEETQIKIEGSNEVGFNISEQ